MKYHGNVMHFIYLSNMIFIPYDIALVSNNMQKINLYNSSQLNKYIWDEHYYITMVMIKDKKLDQKIVNDIRYKAKTIYAGYRQVIVMLFYYDRIKELLTTKELRMVNKGILDKIKKLPNIDQYTLSLCGTNSDPQITNPKEIEGAVFDQLNVIFLEIQKTAKLI